MESTLATLRLRLVDAQARLRQAKDDLGRTQAEREQAAIKAAGGAIGRNEDERKRALTLALTNDADYRRVLAFVRDAESTVNLLEAQIENALDVRRAEEWQIRSRMVDALYHLGAQTDSPDPASDQVFDDATFGWVLSMLDRFANERHHQHAGVAREMLNAYNQGIADRINGAGEYEPDEDEGWDGCDPLEELGPYGPQRLPVVTQPDLSGSVGMQATTVSRHRLDGGSPIDYYNSDEYRTQMDLERADADAFMYEWLPETWQQAA